MSICVSLIWSINVQIGLLSHPNVFTAACVCVCVYTSDNNQFCLCFLELFLSKFVQIYEHPAAF